MNRHRLVALCLLALVGPSVAQDEERTILDVAGDLLASYEEMGLILSGIDSAESAEAASEKLLLVSSRLEQLQLEARRMDDPTEEEARKLDGLQASFEKAGGRFEEELERVRRIPEAARIVQGLPFVARLDESHCKSNLKQIGLAIALHQQKNNDFLPDHGNPAFFEVLLGENPGDGHLFHCPVGTSEGKTDYATWSKGPRITSGFIAKYGSRFPIAWDADPDRHAARRVVLFLDGHVEVYDEPDFLDLLAEWEKMHRNDEFFAR